MNRRIVILLCTYTMLAWAGNAQVGISTTNPLSALDINGNLSLKTIGIPTALVGGTSGNATQINDGIYISLTPITGSFEFIIPNAVSVPGRIYILRNISDTVTARIYSFGGLLFAKDSKTATTPYLDMPSNALLKTVIIISDGLNWTYLF